MRNLIKSAAIVKLKISDCSTIHNFDRIRKKHTAGKDRIATIWEPSGKYKTKQEQH